VSSLDGIGKIVAVGCRAHVELVFVGEESQSMVSLKLTTVASTTYFLIVGRETPPRASAGLALMHSWENERIKSASAAIGCSLLESSEAAETGSSWKQVTDGEGNKAERCMHAQWWMGVVCMPESSLTEGRGIRLEKTGKQNRRREGGGHADTAEGDWWRCVSQARHTR